jgi:hypothetical protein
MEPSLTTASDSLDAVTYFFISSGAFILAIAIPFFILGLWLGGLIWGRYKKMWRVSEEANETLKGEVSQLKRRIAEQATRPLVTFAHQAATPAQSTSAPLRGTVFPEGNMTTIWTEPEWQPPKINVQPSHPSAAFSLWTQPDYLPLLGVPPSRAFTLWTAPEWEPVFTPTAATPPARPFSMWTEAGWEPLKREHPWSTAFSLWTQPDWEPAPLKPAPAPVSTAFSVWTEPGWEPIKRVHPWSVAFTLWTRGDHLPITVKPEPLVQSSAFSLWTAPDYEPPMRVHPWNRSFTLWTTPEWEPLPHKPVVTPASAAFCLWTAPDWQPPAPKPIAPPPAPVPDAAPTVATIFAKAKSATSRIPVVPQDAVARTGSAPSLTPSREMIAAVAASVKPLTPATFVAHEGPPIPAAQAIPAPQPAADAQRPAAPRPQPPRPPQAADKPAPPKGFFSKFVAATKAALGLQKTAAVPRVQPTSKLVAEPANTLPSDGRLSSLAQPRRSNCLAARLSPSGRTPRGCRQRRSLRPSLAPKEWSPPCR